MGVTKEGSSPGANYSRYAIEEREGARERLKKGGGVDGGSGRRGDWNVEDRQLPISFTTQMLIVQVNV